MLYMVYKTTSTHLYHKANQVFAMAVSGYMVLFQAKVQPHRPRLSNPIPWFLHLFESYSVLMHKINYVIVHRNI
jgi:hypothetical protein